MIDLSKEKLKLSYPCLWKYKLVLLKDKNSKKIVSNILGDYKHKLIESKVSKKGKFKSYSLELLVHNEDKRKELYKILGEHKEIKMVL